MEKIEASVGYTVAIKPPIVDDTVEADSEPSATFKYLPVPLEDFEDFLCTIEINGVVHVYRELHSYEETDDYLGFVANGLIVDMGTGEVLVYEADPDEDDPIISEDDKVKLLLEPVKVQLTPSFRAAVKKAYIAVEPEPVSLDDGIDLEDLGDLGNLSL